MRSNEEQAPATPPVNPGSITPKGVRGIVGMPNGKTARRRERDKLTLEQKRAARRLRRQAKGKKAAPVAVAPAAAAPAKKKGK